jgi:hypothetical protein
LHDLVLETAAAAVVLVVVFLVCANQHALQQQTGSSCNAILPLHAKATFRAPHRLVEHRCFDVSLIAVVLVQAIARIPRPTLSALLSIQGVNADVVVGQMKSLAAQDAETISKLVFFTKQVRILHSSTRQQQQQQLHRCIAHRRIIQQ